MKLKKNDRLYKKIKSWLSYSVEVVHEVRLTTSAMKSAYFFLLVAVMLMVAYSMPIDENDERYEV